MACIIAHRYMESRVINLKEMIMEKYINKLSVVAEIEKKGKQYANERNTITKNSENYYVLLGRIKMCDDILSFIDSIEVKEENNLDNLFQALPEKIADEKSHQVYELSIYHYDGQCVVDYVGEIDHDSLYCFSGNSLYEAIEKAWNWLKENAKVE